MFSSAKKFIKNAVYRLIPPPPIPASYSQAGEDAILRFLFTDKKLPQISYLDIGTNSPDEGNNTYLFYRDGARGVCVEADKSLIGNIRKIRPADKILNAGIAANATTEADFYIFELSALNTFDKAEAEARVAQGPYRVIEVAKVPLIDINSVIKDNFAPYPDLISLDIEGLDLAVLQTLDFAQYPVPVICAETCLYSTTHIRPKNTAIFDFMIAQGYTVYADTYINTIFVKRDWFNRISNRAKLT